MCVSEHDDKPGGHGGDEDLGMGGALNPEGLSPGVMKYADEIAYAAAKAGVDPNLLAAVIQAESRGNPFEASNNPEDGQPDVGLTQISQSTYNDVAARQGLGPINVGTPEKPNVLGNILAGAYELKEHIQDTGSVTAGLNAYVGDDPNYVPRVMAFYHDMVMGIPMPDQDPV